MTGRLWAGQRGDDVGLWLSRPGVEVETAIDADCLISPGAKNLQFLMRGTVFVPVNTTQTVLFGEILSSPPAVWFSASVSGGYWLPQFWWGTSGLGLGDRFRVTTQADRFSASNSPGAHGTSPVDLTLRYLVIGAGS